MPQAQCVDRPWLLDENYAAFVSVGALVPGWSLVAPKQHVFNLSTYYSKNSFWQFVDRAVDVVERTYGRAVIFEHGSVDAESMTSCGTAHAHLHIVPLSFELSAKAIGFDQGLQWEECSIVRSEEHTSELQSLMRISYAVYCLKKNKNEYHHKNSHDASQAH